MLTSKPVNKIIFLDLETVPQKESFFDLSAKMQDAFLWKFKKEAAELGLGRKEHYIQEAIQKQGRVLTCNELDELEADDRAKTEALYNNKASLFAEFGKIICCSIGYFEGIPTDPQADYVFKASSFYGDDEKEMLSKLNTTMDKIWNVTLNPSHHFCAHNGKVFDFPFLAKRYIINGLPLPSLLDQDGRKPWEMTHFIDTKETWQFNVRDNAATLDLLCECFGVQSSKDDIKGSEVRDVYYKNKDLERIVKYCEKDVVALATVYLRMKSILNSVIIK